VDALLDVDPGAEGPVSGRAQDDDVHVVVFADHFPDLGELVAHRLVEAVHRLRSVQCDRRNVLCDLVGHVKPIAPPLKNLYSLDL
jgi:hypothetical protein